MNTKQAADMKCPYFISNGEKCIRCDSVFYDSKDDDRHRTVHTFSTAAEREHIMYSRCAFYPNDCELFRLLELLE